MHILMNNNYYSQLFIFTATVVEPSSSHKSKASSHHRLFQCLSQNSVTSVQDENHYYIPSVPVDLDSKNLVNFRAPNFRRAIFIPQSQLCNGTIRSIEYCYQAPMYTSQSNLELSPPQVVFKFFFVGSTEQSQLFSCQRYQC